ncbi:MAG: multidrug efflux SMR transporter [Desulfobacteraceae bacterium]|nr:multidrug efflux SMR transporter [Desulfobacteraceae bacterium]
MKQWIYLFIAIVSEVIGTSALKPSDGFTRLWPSLAVLIGYIVSFYYLSLTLKTMPVGIAYAIWSGVGVVLVVIIGWFFFNQKLDWPAIAGISLIMTGVVILNFFSKTVSH